MNGYIVKGIGGFYYVKTAEGIVECKPRGIFRKQKRFLPKDPDLFPRFLYLLPAQIRSLLKLAKRLCHLFIKFPFRITRCRLLHFLPDSEKQSLMSVLMKYFPQMFSNPFHRKSLIEVQPFKKGSVSSLSCVLLHHCNRLLCHIPGILSFHPIRL